MTIWWLVLIVTGVNHASPTMLHVGNFKDKATCIAAADQSGRDGPSIVPPSTLPHYWVCVKANDDVTTPPHEPSL